jgi:hypothetical protein
MRAAHKELLRKIRLRKKLDGSKASSRGKTKAKKKEEEKGGSSDSPF